MTMSLVILGLLCAGETDDCHGCGQLKFDRFFMRASSISHCRPAGRMGGVGTTRVKLPGLDSSGYDSGRGERK